MNSMSEIPLLVAMVTKFFFFAISLHKALYKGCPHLYCSVSVSQYMPGNGTIFNRHAMLNVCSCFMNYGLILSIGCYGNTFSVLLNINGTAIQYELATCIGM